MLVMVRFPLVKEAVAAAGGPSAVARAAGISEEAVRKWNFKGLPDDRVIWLAELTGWRFLPHQLAHTLYPHPEDGLPPPVRERVARRAAA
jgi:hypothetical protein